MPSPPLDAFFAPRNVVVIGATEAPGSIGRTLLSNLMATSFGGPIYAVNPKRSSVLGLKSHSHIGAIAEKVDLAIVATPAATVPDIIAGCAEAGVQGAIIISAGFREVGGGGAALEQDVMLRRGSMRIIGPNCMGVMSPFTGLNA